MSSKKKILASSFSDIKDLNCYLRNLIREQVVIPSPIFFGDTNTLNIEGTGSEGNPYVGHGILSQAPDNSLEILEDGYFNRNLIANGVIAGGIVTWVDDYNYHVSPAIYYINNVRYNQNILNPEGFDFTLTSPDLVNNRIDTFVVNTDGETVVLQGIPSSNPAQAELDPATELQLSIALVEVGTTEPTINVECIYKNNVEWTTLSSDIVKLDPNSLAAPCDGVKAIRGTNANANTNLLLSRGSVFTPGNTFTQLTFQARPITVWGGQMRISFRWELAGVPVGSAVSFGHGTFGFIGTNLTSCQIVAIPMTSFGLVSGQQVDSLRITSTSAVGINFTLDEICVQNTPIVAIPSSPDEKVKVSTNDTTAGYLLSKLSAGTGISLSTINPGGIEQLQISATIPLTANNGMKRVADNFELGDPLIKDTIISSAAFTLDIASTHTGRTLGIVNSSANGDGLHVQANSVGIDSTSINNVAVHASSAAAEAFFGNATSSTVATLSRDLSVGNLSADVLDLQTVSSVAGAIGLGSRINTKLTASDLSLQQAGYFSTEWTTATVGSRTAKTVMALSNNAVMQDVFTMNGSGQATLNRYTTGVAAFTGTPTFGLAVDTNGNIIQVAASTTYTATSGIYPNTATNFRLGGTLLEDTEIDTTTDYTLTITGALGGGVSYGIPVVEIISTSLTGTALKAIMNNGTGDGTAFEATALNGGSAILATTFGFGTSISTISVEGIALAATNNSSVDNDIITIIALYRNCQSTPQDGIGMSIDFNIEKDTPTNTNSNSIISKLVDVSTATPTSQLIITGIDSGVVSNLFTLDGNGRIIGNKYGSGAITGGAAAFGIAVDNQGRFIEIALGGGGGGTVNSVAGTANRITSTGGTDPTIDIHASYVGQASITTLGTITTGTWQGTAIASGFGGTGFTTYTTGDMIIASAANTLSKIGIGTNGQVWTVVAGLPAWATISGTGTVTSVSGGTTGLTFTNPSTAAVMTGTLIVPNGGTGLITIAQGSIIYGSATNTYSALAKNTTATRYLANTGTSNNPAWSQVNLANGVTGVLPFANITSGNGKSVFGVTGNTGTTMASITASAGDQILRVNTANNTLAFGSINLAVAAAVGSSILRVDNGGTGIANVWTNGDLPIGNTTGNLLVRAKLTEGNAITVTNGPGAITIAYKYLHTPLPLTDATTTTWNVLLGENAEWILGNINRTLVMSNTESGRIYNLKVIQGTGGNKTIGTYPTGTKWVGGIPPTLPTVEGQYIMISFYRDAAGNLNAVPSSAAFS